eukprot:jgi/Bigna1/130434/aug1.11_g5142
MDVGLQAAANALEQFDKKANSCFKRMDDSLNRHYTLGDALRDRKELLSKIQDIEDILSKAKLDLLYPTSRKPGDSLEKETESVAKDIERVSTDFRQVRKSARTVSHELRQRFPAVSLKNEAKSVKGYQMPASKG